MAKQSKQSEVNHQSTAATRREVGSAKDTSNKPHSGTSQSSQAAPTHVKTLGEIAEERSRRQAKARLKQTDFTPRTKPNKKSRTQNADKKSQSNTKKSPVEARKSPAAAHKSPAAVRSQEKVQEATVIEKTKEVAESEEVLDTKPPVKPVRNRRPMPFFFRILFSGLLLAGLSIIYTWFIFWRQRSGNFEATLDMITGNVAIFAYSCLLIFLAMAVIAAITWRVFFTAGFSFAVISAIMYANEQKMMSRATPLLPEDFLMADQVGAMTHFVDMGEVMRLISGIVLLMIGVCLFEHFVRRWIGRDPKQTTWWERFSLVPRVTFTLMSMAALVLAAQPIMQHSGGNYYSVDWLGAEMEAWNQNSNYYRNGFVLGFVYNLGTTKAERPEDYNEQRIQEILAKYEQIQDAENLERERLSDVVDNIIFVMDESFYDPLLLTEEYPYEGSDLIPVIRDLMKKYPSGYMYSPEYGGGTANVEFEAYTGLTNYWAQAMPYVDFLSKNSRVPGLVRLADQNGFTSTAVHPYFRSMYKRSLVYPNMGFDKFIDIDDMTHTERESPTTYINDRSVYREALDIIENSDEPQMLGLITIQNHTGFDCGRPSGRDVSLTKNFSVQRVNSYICLHKTDLYLEEFIEELEASDKRTVMIWFGDHAAGVLDDYINSDNKMRRDIAHLTPYFIYANFELEELYSVKEVAATNSASGLDYAQFLTKKAKTSAEKLLASNAAKSINLPTTTPNCLSNTLLDALNAKKSALYYLVGEVCSTTPILATSYYEGEAPASSEVLKEYQLVNYDILNGEQYWLK